MRLPRRDFAPPRNDMRFMKAVLNDKLQSLQYAERIIATSRVSPMVCPCPAQPRTHCLRALPAKLQFNTHYKKERTPEGSLF